MVSVDLYNDISDAVIPGTFYILCLADCRLYASLYVSSTLLVNMWEIFNLYYEAASKYGTGFLLG